MSKSHGLMQSPAASSDATGAEASGDCLGLCRECGWVMRLPRLSPGHNAHCPRCNHVIRRRIHHEPQKIAAWALTTLISLGFVFVFDFLSLSTHGFGHTMTFFDTAHSLFAHGYPALTFLFLSTTVGLPALYLVALLFLWVGERGGKMIAGRRLTLRVMAWITPWLMTDVFIVGVLVALIKIISLAQIHLDPSFVAFCVYSLLLLYTASLVDRKAFWHAIRPEVTPAGLTPGVDSQSQNIAICEGCDAPRTLNPRAPCPRCGLRQPPRRSMSLQSTWALLVSAAICYIPANLYPVLSTRALGQSQPQTLIAGVRHLAQSGDWPIAAVVFTASVVIPISKILALGWLCLTAHLNWHRDARQQTRLYRITEKIGRWSMIDVFVVATLGALVQVGAFMSITPGRGIIAFAAVVVLTMIAARTFDPRLLWSAADRPRT